MSGNRLLVAMLPLDITEASPESNIENITRELRHMREDAAILVLPELFSTGFIKDEATFELLAEPFDGDTMKRLKEIANCRGIAVAGSMLCRDSHDGSLRNRAFFINPDNDCEVSFYDKRHLFPLSPEHRIFKGGTRNSPVIRFRSWNIALSICFDLRFPVWNRNVGNKYDMLIVPANWPDSRIHAWQTLLMARAIENMAPAIGVNRAGTDMFGTYSYLSTMAVNERGENITRTHGNTPLRYSEFDLDNVKEFRERFPVYKIADNFRLENDNN